MVLYLWFGLDSSLKPRIVDIVSTISRFNHHCQFDSCFEGVRTTDPDFTFDLLSQPSDPVLTALVQGKRSFGMLLMESSISVCVSSRAFTQLHHRRTQPFLELLLEIGRSESLDELRPKLLPLTPLGVYPTAIDRIPILGFTDEVNCYTSKSELIILPPIYQANCLEMLQPCQRIFSLSHHVDLP